MDREVHVLWNKALIVLEFFGVQLAHCDADHMTAQIKNRTAGVAFVDLGSELESAFVVLHAGALGDHAVGQRGRTFPQHRPQRIAHDHDIASHARFGVGIGGNGAVGRQWLFKLQHGEVIRRREEQQAGFDDLAQAGAHGELLAAFDHVPVGDNFSATVHNETAAAGDHYAGGEGEPFDRRNKVFVDHHGRHALGFPGLLRNRLGFWQHGLGRGWAIDLQPGLRDVASKDIALLFVQRSSRHLELQPCRLVT